jgi:predicted lactoylglutathione lyase
VQEDRFVTTSDRKLFVNIAVRELDKSKAFFSRLGFEFNPDFTDDNAACMVLSEQGFVMLLAEPFFKSFTRRQLADTSTSTEALLALSCASREEVDALVQTALDAGGALAMDPQDHGFMYVRSFYDLDGHHWEIFWMDPAAQKQG